MERRRSKTDSPTRTLPADFQNPPPSGNSPRTHFTALNMEASFTEDTHVESHHSGSEGAPPDINKKTSVYVAKQRSSSISQGNALINVQASFLARSKASFTYPILAQIGGAEKWLSNVIQDGTDAQIENQSTPSPKKEEGFFTDLERKGFTGIWGHPITRLYFLMYLIWNGYENIYILRSELLEYRNQFFSISNSNLRLNFYKKLRRGFFTDGSLFNIDWPPNISDPSIQEVMDKIQMLADLSPANIYDDLAYICIRTLEMVFENKQFASMHDLNAIQPATRSLSKEEKSASDQDLKKGNSAKSGREDSAKGSTPSKTENEKSTDSQEILEKKLTKGANRERRQSLIAQSLVTVEENKNSPLLTRKKLSKQDINSTESPLAKRKKKVSRQSRETPNEGAGVALRPVLSPTEAGATISEDTEIGAPAIPARKVRQSKALEENGTLPKSPASANSLNNLTTEGASVPAIPPKKVRKSKKLPEVSEALKWEADIVPELKNEQPPTSETFPSKSSVSNDHPDDSMLKPAPPAGRPRENSGGVRTNRRGRLLSNDSGKNQPILSASNSANEMPSSSSSKAILGKVEEANSGSMVVDKAASPSDPLSNAAESPQKISTPPKVLPKIDTRIAQNSLKYKLVSSLRVSFQESGFYQALKNDFRGTAHITDNQCMRAIERIRDLCRSTKMEISKYEVFVALLEDFKFEFDIPHQKRGKATSVQTSSLRLDEGPPMSVTTAPSILTLDGSPALSHTFVKLDSSVESKYCEYCFKNNRDGALGDVMSCASCGFICHKQCRNQSTLKCVKTSSEKEVTVAEGNVSESIIQLQETLQALQREVDIELRIQEGIEKMAKAKRPISYGSGKKKETEVKDMTSQSSKNSKRLDLLKHEIQKRQVQIQNLQKNEVKGTLGKSSSMANIGDTGLLRVTVIDPETKSELKKALYIQENQSTLEVIQMILTKSNMKGEPSEYQLAYGPADATQSSLIVLRDQGRPMQIEDINYAETHFCLSKKDEFGPDSHKIHTRYASPTTLDLPKGDPLLKKQLEIISEIIDSEKKYVDDLHAIESVFVIPLKVSMLVNSDAVNTLFSNIHEIQALHEEILAQLEHLPSVPNKSSVIDTIRVFANNVANFNCYQIYCAHQYIQKDFWKEKESNSAFMKYLATLEANPKLHKLKASDMMMKPMQKITRYPLLFRRLLPNTLPDSPEHDILSNLIVDMERAVSLVNQKAHFSHAAFKTGIIGKNLDFNTVCEKFTLNSEDRLLLHESSLKYMLKNGSFIDVVVFLFNDLMLITKRKNKDGNAYSLYKAPIPFESAVFLSKVDPSGVDTTIQVIHVQHDTHLLQAYSAFDKNLWLQEAESARARFCAYFLENEAAYIKPSLKLYRTFLPSKSASVEPQASAAGGFFSPFFKKKVGSSDNLNDNNTPRSATKSNKKAEKSEKKSRTDSSENLEELPKFKLKKAGSEVIQDKDGSLRASKADRASLKDVIKSQNFAAMRNSVIVSRTSIMTSQAEEAIEKPHSMADIAKTVMHQELINKQDKKFKPTLMDKLKDQFANK